MKLVNLGPSALFSKYSLKTSSGKHLQDISPAHIVSLLYKLITSSRYCDDLSIGFDRCCDRRKQELIINKRMKGKNILELCSRIYLVLLNINIRLLMD